MFMSKIPECFECQKTARVLYKELGSKDTSPLFLCRECVSTEEKTHNLQAEVSCINCLTTLEAIRNGQPPGCNQCYTVFGNFLVDELLAKYAPSQFQETDSFHLSPSPTVLDNKISLLYCYIEEALQQEDYEQVAHLQHQIEFLQTESRFSFSSISSQVKPH